MSKATTRQLLNAGAIGIVAAVVLNAIVFFIARAASSDNLLLTPFGADGPEELPLVAVIFSTVIGGLVAIGLAALISRFTSRPQTIFVTLCVVALVLYAFAPFGAAEQTSTAIWLNVLHVVAAIPIVGGLARTLSAE